MRPSSFTLPRILLGIAVCLAVAFSLVSPMPTYSQGSGTAITGFAWSDTIGWVSLNCSDLGTCGTSTYGLAIGSDGTITGYAWSENVGWISANAADLTGCPTSPCTARMNQLAMQGWLKAVSGGSAQSGGWDGFISLSGTNYGPTLASTTLSGYAWGDVNVGWLHFSSSYPTQTAWLPACATSYACTDLTHRQSSCTNAPIEACSAGQICAVGACVLPPAPSTSEENQLKVSPRLVRAGGTVSISWLVSDATTCSVTENSSGITDSWTATSSAAASCTHSGSACVTSPIFSSVTYTLSCTGPGGTLTQSATVFNNPNWKEL